MLPAILFYIFSTVTILSALAVVSSKSPVQSVLFLILAFFNVAGLFLLLGAEFVAMLLVIVYVGAVAVLFLFVVMMLNVSAEHLRQNFVKNLPIGIVIALVLFAEIFMMFTQSVGEIIPAEVQDQGYYYKVSDETLKGLTNTQKIGLELYTDYAFLFQLAGLILLVAMIGAIVLTHRKRTGVRKQVIKDQVARDPKTAVTLVKVESGKGIE
jgi:NADH-quinone oxidoreductase subunit J